jgi:sporulation protein YlmC with PRC-barrel domain
MPPEANANEPATLRFGALLGQPVHDRDGRLLGRVADVVTEADADGREQITELMVTKGPWGRLLGYEDSQPTGPWLLDRLARAIFRRDAQRVDWSDVQVGDD